jgi:hypothetical protein
VGLQLKIHALCLIKNERDIIEQTLRRAAKWCDYIYVLDNGSDDGTWEVVQELSRELDAVRPFKSDPQPFFDNIRDEIFRTYSDRAVRDDWWCVLDADEFYIDDPRVFLSEVPKTTRAVWPLMYNYLFTDRDLERYHERPEVYGDDVPIEEKLRHYMVADYAELRFFRHSPLLKRIPVRGYYPVHAQRIRVKHFAYRSPDQIAKRLETRRDAMRRGDFVHEKRSNWQPGGWAAAGPALESEIPASWEERVTPARECHFDDLDGRYAVSPDWKAPVPPHWRTRLRSRLDESGQVAARLLRRLRRRVAGAGRASRLSTGRQ